MSGYNARHGQTRQGTSLGAANWGSKKPCLRTPPPAELWSFSRRTIRGESWFIVVDFLTIILFSSHWARNVHIKNCNTRFKYYIKIFMSDTYQNTLMIRIMHGKYYVIMQKCSFYSINEKVHYKLIPNIQCLSWNNKKYVGAQYPLRIGKCDMFFLLPKWSHMIMSHVCVCFPQICDIIPS